MEFKIKKSQTPSIIMEKIDAVLESSQNAKELRQLLRNLAPSIILPAQYYGN